MEDRVEIKDRITFDGGGQPLAWLRSINSGPWERVDCSAYPSGRPPFVYMAWDDRRFGPCDFMQRKFYLGKEAKT